MMSLRIKLNTLLNLMLILTFVVWVNQVQAVKFDLSAGSFETGGHQRCLSQFINKDTLVSGSVDIDGNGDNSRLEMNIYDESITGNVYFTKHDVKESFRFSFTTHRYASILFCFVNTMNHGHPLKGYREITLHVDSGAAAADYAAESVGKKLDNADVAFKKLHALLKEVDKEMEYLKEREQAMRDVNEITNERVKHLSILTMIIFGILSIYQIIHLKSFFSSKVKLTIHNNNCNSA